MTLPAPSRADISAYRRDGVVVLRSALGGAEVATLGEWVDEVGSWAAAGSAGLHHFETADAGAVLARSERFADDHGGLGDFLRGGDLGAVLAGLVGEEQVLFKEKVNYKHPGGGGFAPHQDAVAYRQADRHVSVMVPLDPATAESGCLWFAAHPSMELLPTDDRGRIAAAAADSLDWRPVEVQPGDLVVFESHAPHRSDTNRSDRPRRALFLTYNPASEGDLRGAYYADKVAEFETAGSTFGGERVRLSISDDFLGRPVPNAEGQVAPPPLDELVSLYRSPLAQQHYDEAVTELEHALQAAALAEADGAPAEVVAAALLHDVGHLVADDLVGLDQPLVDVHHEAVGARYLRRWFAPGVTDAVALHVAAKRYLCAVDPEYLGGLSPSSVRSLAAQGGPMGPGEVVAFERNPRHGPAVQLRRWDDRAKVAGLDVGAFDRWLPVLEALRAGWADRRTAPGPGVGRRTRLGGPAVV